MAPEVARSRSAMTRRRVVLPQPEGPISDTNWPARTVRSTPDSAWTGAPPASKTTDSDMASITGLAGSAGATRAGALAWRAGLPTAAVSKLVTRPVLRPTVGGPAPPRWVIRASRPPPRIWCAPVPPAPGILQEVGLDPIVGPERRHGSARGAEAPEHPPLEQ